MVGEDELVAQRLRAAQGRAELQARGWTEPAAWVGTPPDDDAGLPGRLLVLLPVAGTAPDSAVISLGAAVWADRAAGRDGAREIAGMYLANKVQNIQGAADTLLDLAELTQDEIRPVAEAMERGGRLAAKAEVTDAILDKCKPIAGTPADCIAAIEEYRDAGCTHVMLELWGDKRHDQIRLFGEKVLPHFR